MGIGRWMAVLLLCAGLSACDGDRAPASRQTSPSSAFDEGAARAALVDLYAGERPSRHDVRIGGCFAERFLDSTTVQQLADGGLLDARGRVVDDAPALDATLADAWADAQFGCVDFVAESTRAMALVERGALDEAAYAACLRATLTDEQQRAAVTAALRGRFDDAAVDDLARAQSTCADRATP